MAPIETNDNAAQNPSTGRGVSVATKPMDCTAMAIAVQSMGFVATDTPLPVLGFCAALSLVSIGAMIVLDRLIAQAGQSQRPP